MTTDDRPIEDLDLSVCAYSCLARRGIKTIGALRRLSDEDLFRIRNLSQARIDEIKQSLTAYPCQELVPVVHAHWIDRDHGFQMCSSCGEECAEESELPFRCYGYCPHCGAKMDEKE